MAFKRIIRGVDHKIRESFRKLGEAIAIHPKYFIIATTILSIVLSTGILQIKYNDDIFELYSIANGRSNYEKAQIKKYFRTNYTGSFTFSRIVELGHYARILVTAQDGGTVLRSKIWEEIMEIDNYIHSIKIDYKGKIYNYSQLCAQNSPNTCQENDILDLSKIIERIEDGSIILKYPYMINVETYQSYSIPTYFGGFQLTEDNFTLLSAEALGLRYILKFETLEDDEKGNLWEQEVTKWLKNGNWKHINVYQNTFYAFGSEQDKNILQPLPFIPGMLFLMFIFSTGSTFSKDWVRSKPLVAFFGICSVGLATLASFGFMFYIGVELIGINVAVLFLMIGIGIDDMFVILSAWRQTNRLDPVEKRLGDTYAEAAVSITITSLTDMLSFYVGLLTPVPSVQIFCAYAGTSIFWIYVYQLFFFGAILGISGKIEAENKHSIFFWKKISPKSLSDGKSLLYKSFFTGGIDKMDPTNPKDNQENSVMAFFRDYFAKFICFRWVKIFVVILFVGYIGVAIYGLLQINEGLKEERLYLDESHVAKYFFVETKYFKPVFYQVQVGIVTPLDYSDPKIQSRVFEVIESLVNSSIYITNQNQENWLKGLLDYAENWSEFDDTINLSNSTNFIRTLREKYFFNNPQSGDVAFNEDGTQIIASRFVLQCINTFDNTDIEKAVVALRKVAASHKDMEVIVFNPWFIFVDQFIQIRPMTIQLLSIAAAVVMLVAIVFIPNLVTACCVFFTIASTELGVIGFMSLWGVSLDMISLLCLIMCVGFSVDFSAHISYAYVSSNTSLTSQERISKAMYSLGLPIIQGGVSTIVGVSCLLFIPSYIFQVFFKVVILVITIAALHGFFVLPVLLMLIKPEKICCNRHKENNPKINVGIDNLAMTSS